MKGDNEMNKNEFIAQASKSQTIWSHIDIYIPEGTEDYVYHRYGYVNSNNGETYKRICRSMIRYAKPSWSEYQEPYFMRHGMREYLADYMVNK
jgi:hypothetical protein